MLFFVTLSLIMALIGLFLHQPWVEPPSVRPKYRRQGAYLLYTALGTFCSVLLVLAAKVSFG